VASGELAFALGTSASSGSLQRAGKLRYIAVAAPKRVAAFADVPTVGESGGPAGFEVIGWTLIAAPRGLPPERADKIRRDIEKALSEPDIKTRYDTFGYELFPQTPDQFVQFIGTESSRFADVIKKANVTLD
jgi:tripartite-type tricarboxylate transporter receptor subunit TctC